jgi:O-acetyl-ADP-ribose deacetylase (regulator of RNase III)
MAYREFKGNIFASRAQTLVNTVNCVGVMGKGVALEFRRRFPCMYAEYRRVCVAKNLLPGQILPFRKETPWILNFAVKDDWKHPSRMEWVESCLRKFVDSYKRLGIKSVAMPWIGAMNGKLPWSEVHNLMRLYLQNLPEIDIEVIEFDPLAPDPLFDILKQMSESKGSNEFALQAEISESSASAIFDAIRTGRASSMSTLSELDRLGNKTIERLYCFTRQIQLKAALPDMQSTLI